MKSVSTAAALMVVAVSAATGAAAESADGDLQKHIDALADAKSMGREMCIKVRNIGRDLSCMGAAPVKPLAKLLGSDSRSARWAAAVVLAMIGPEASAALPALDRVFRNEKEDIVVRVRAARAMTAIKGTDVWELYKAIPDLEKRVYQASRDVHRYRQSKKLWRDYLAGKTGEHWRAYRNDDGELDRSRVFHDLATNQNLKEANQWLRDRMAKNADYGGRFVVWMFGSNSGQFPGRLEPDVEHAMKAKLFDWIEKGGGKDWGKSKPSSVLKKLLAREAEGLHVMYTHNWISRSDGENYINLQCLKDDPKFRSRKFKIPEGRHPLFRQDRTLLQGGDTVLERYTLYTEYFRRGLKQWALHGLFNELASPHYEQKTYWGLFWVRDFATDPVVKQRMAMFMDLAMVDIMQASLSGVRGGCKSRAKSGGLTSRLDRDLARWLGEHHQHLLEIPGFDGFLAPEPAVLLRQLGPTQPVFEITNRLGQESKPGAGENAVFLRSRSANYVYRTPDYTIGCAMFDPTRRYGPLGFWSGVIFRDKKAVWLDAYTGEKRGVQHKDVMIAQCVKGKHYGGHPRVDFTPGLTPAETDGWVFVSNDEAYVAVKVVTGGSEWKTPARRLVLKEKYSPIIIQTGRKADYGSFEKFQQAILAAPLKITESVLDYTGPNSARIEFFLCKDSDDFNEAYPKSLPRIDGKELDLNLKHNYRSPYMNNTVGSDVVTVSYGNRKWLYDFDKNTVTEKR